MHSRPRSTTTAEAVPHPTFRRAAAAAAALATLTTAACGSDPTSDLVQRTDSAGIAVVTNLGPDRPLAWTREPILRLGGEEQGPEAFFRVLIDGVGADDARRLYILDAGEFQVRVFDAEGRHLRTMGREGEGPGELKMPVALFALGGGEVQVVDLGKHALVRFDADGAPLPQIPLPPTVRTSTSRPTPVARGMVVSIDTVLNETGTLRPGTPLRDRLMLHTARDGTWVDTAELAAIDWRRPESFNPVGSATCPMKVQTPPIFTRQPVWRAGGDRVLHNGTDEYVVDVTDLRGRRLMSIRRALPVHTATRELAAAEIGALSGVVFRGVSCDATAEERADQAGWSDRIPWILDVARTPAGEILVRRRAPGEQPASRVDVFTAGGEYAGTLPADFPLPLVWRGPDEYLQVEHDDDGLPRVIVYRIRRSTR